MDMSFRIFTFGALSAAYFFLLCLAVAMPSSNIGALQSRQAHEKMVFCHYMVGFREASEEYAIDSILVR